MTPGTLLALGVAAVAGVGVSAVGGYLFGYHAAQAAPARRLQRMRNDADRCVSEVLSSMDLAGKFCDVLAGSAKAAERHLDAITDRQCRLAEAIGRLLAARRSPGGRGVPEVTWDRGAIDPETQLPDRTGFGTNVARLAAGADVPRGGILVVSIDGIDRLRRRFGETGTAELRRSAARVLCRAGREEDLACTVDAERFALLFPDAEPEDALKQAGRVRDEFRSHPFRIGTDGPEVLVTASFGFTPVMPGDEIGLVLDRTDAAAARARRWGRNRFYAYDPAANRLVQVTGSALERQTAAAEG